MYILKYKDDSLKIRHYRELLRDLEYDCEFNEIQMSDYDLIETHENIIATPTGDIYTESDFETIKKSKEYQDKLAKQERERRNEEIDEKIKELQIMAIPEILNGNIENIKIYNDVISGLENARL